MAAYFLSDVHLRLDRPERADRLARLVDRLSADDDLTIAGDLCDFWFASRQRRGDPMRCPGLRALADFRGRGGSLVILPGNHDAWLGSFYEQALGARFVSEPFEKTVAGVSVHVVHGHRLGARKPWKSLMESRAFLGAFSALPDPVAQLLAVRLERSNETNLAETHRRHLAVYRSYARQVAESRRADLILFGHVHDLYDEPAASSRLIVLGDWIDGSSYLQIDEDGVRFVVDRPMAAELKIEH